MRWLAIIVAGLVLWPGCSPLPKDELPATLVDLTEIPADYGELVAVVPYPNPENVPRWYELWFENEESGTITFVPMYRPQWRIDPAKIKVIRRTPSATQTGGES